jgi:hypothetical protein
MSDAATSVRTIFIIRHGEKPDPPALGLDVYGKPDKHSLLPRGWHRAAALAMLFAPAEGVLRLGLATPTELIAPDYGNADANIVHRTHQTILPLARLLGLKIETKTEFGGKKVDFKEGNEAAVGTAVASEPDGVTLICWEHHHIHDIANSIPTPAGTKIPQSWPGDRFDVILSFTRDSGPGPYTFTQILERLFPDDGTTPIDPQELGSQ